eukprot:239003_1
MEEQEKATNVYFDSQFARLNRRILERRDNTASFDRFAPKNTKFNIVNAEQLKQDTKLNSSTYLDEMVKHLLNSRVEEICIKQFMQFINQQQYDTDAIDHDHAMKPNRNISSTHVDETLLKYYNRFIADAQHESLSFNIGFRFYYWPYYKRIKEPHQEEFNTWDHSGYDIKELFIEAKYA